MYDLILTLSVITILTDGYASSLAQLPVWTGESGSEIPRRGLLGFLVRARSWVQRSAAMELNASCRVKVKLSRDPLHVGEHQSRWLSAVLGAPEPPWFLKEQCAGRWHSSLRGWERSAGLKQVVSAPAPWLPVPHSWLPAPSSQGRCPDRDPTEPWGSHPVWTDPWDRRRAGFSRRGLGRWQWPASTPYPRIHWMLERPLQGQQELCPF